MAKAQDYRDQNLQELEASYEESCRKLFDLKNQSKTQQKREKPHEIRHVRKDIARLLTVMTEKRSQSNV